MASPTSQHLWKTSLCCITGKNWYRTAGDNSMRLDSTQTRAFRTRKLNSPVIEMRQLDYGSHTEYCSCFSYCRFLQNCSFLQNWKSIPIQARSGCRQRKFLAIPFLRGTGQFQKTCTEWMVQPQVANIGSQFAHCKTTVFAHKHLKLSILKNTMFHFFIFFVLTVQWDWRL